MDIQELERLNKMIKLMPRNADAYFYRGYFHLEQGQFEKALMDFSIAIDIKPNHFNAYLFKTIGMDLYQKLLAQPRQSEKNVPDQSNSQVLKYRNNKKTIRSLERKATSIQFPQFEQKSTFPQQMRTNSKNFFSLKQNQISPFNLLTQNTNRQNQNQTSDFNFPLVENLNQKSTNVNDHIIKSKSQQILKLQPQQYSDKKYNEYSYESINVQKEKVETFKEELKKNNENQQKSNTQNLQQSNNENLQKSNSENLQKSNKQNLQQSNQENPTSEILVQYQLKTQFSSEMAFEYLKTGLQNLTQKEYQLAYINFSESETCFRSQSTNLSQTQCQFDEQKTFIESLKELKQQSQLASCLQQKQSEQITLIQEQKQLVDQALLIIENGTQIQQQLELLNFFQQISQQLKNKNQELKINQLETTQFKVNQQEIDNDEEKKNQYQVSLIVRLFCYLLTCQKIDKALKKNAEINIEQENQILQTILFETQEQCKTEIEQYSFPFELFQIINESGEILQNRVTINQIRKLSQLLDQSIPEDSSLQQEIILGSKQFKNQGAEKKLNIQKLPLAVQEKVKKILVIEKTKENDFHWLKGIYDFFIILSYLIEHSENQNSIIKNQLNEIIIQALNKNSLDSEIIEKIENNKKMVQQVEKSCCCSCCTCCSSCCIIF